MNEWLKGFEEDWVYKWIDGFFEEWERRKRRRGKRKRERRYREKEEDLKAGRESNQGNVKDQ